MSTHLKVVYGFVLNDDILNAIYDLGDKGPETYEFKVLAPLVRNCNGDALGYFGVEIDDIKVDGPVKRDNVFMTPSHEQAVRLLRMLNDATLPQELRECMGKPATWMLLYRDR